MDDSLTPLLTGLGIRKEVFILDPTIILALIVMVIIIVLVKKSDLRD